MPENDRDPYSAPSLSTDVLEHTQPPGLSTHAPGHLGRLVDRARAYVEPSSSANTRRAYASDWKAFTGWCRRQGLSPLLPDPQTVGLYITALASGSGALALTASKSKGASVATIERRLSAI